MRRQILTLSVMAVTLAVTVFGVPLAVVARQLIYADQNLTLERLALRGAIAVSSDALLSGDPVELPAGDPQVDLGIYDTAGHLVSGHGPAVGGAGLQAALTAQVADASTSAEIVVAVPVSDQEHVIAIARAAYPRSAVQRKVVTAWSLMAAAAAIAVLSAVIVARVRTRRLTEPLRQLTAMAEELGGGNLAARAPHSGIDEIDRTGVAMNRTASRLQDLLERERQFSARASHQLRTPLTGLRLTLETALVAPSGDLHGAAREALSIAGELERTIDDVLTLSQGDPRPGEAIDAATVLDDIARRWGPRLRTAGRELVVRTDDPPVGLASLAGVRQILDVLLDNALRHGRGTVTVVARRSTQALAFDVIDEGSTAGRRLVADPPTTPPPTTPPPTERIGLRMAASLAAGQGGRLVHDHTAPTTLLTLLLPAGASDAPPGAAPS